MSNPDTDPSTGLPIGPLVANPTPAPRPQRIILAGHHVTLAPINPSTHADALYAATYGAENDRLWLYIFDGPFTDRASFDAYINKIAVSEDPLYFAILDNASGQAVGHASYLRIEPAQRCIEVGAILYTPALQRSAGATEAMYLMAKHVFEDLGYRRYEWKCNALNAPSWRAALRLGFTYEGTFRQHMIVKGRNRDTAWFSMLDSEWPARKTAFEQWLDPANFDAAGQQKIALSTLNGVTS
ncbi:MAG: GNAT family acetyltransferase [Ktedonobacterales bacterium]|jgi:RimJ/RimL family protein N-acetyltransferase|nr:MAG: GNAT family acetyltransferase [Ktedonobacterales bacterium]